MAGAAADGDPLEHTWAVVVTFNSAASIDACLAGLLEALPPSRVVVVDNDSSDGTPELVEERRPGVQVLRTGENMGFGRACNVGTRLAMDGGAAFVFHVNDDALTTGEALRSTVAAAERNPTYGFLFPVAVKEEDGPVDPAVLGELFLRGNLKDRSALLSDALLGRLGDVYPAGRLPGAVLLARRQCLEKVGGYDPLFFVYGAEFDLCRRTEVTRWKVGVVPGAVVIHDYERPQPPTPREAIARSRSDSYSFGLLVAKRLRYPFVVGAALALGVAALRSVHALLGERDLPKAVGIVLSAPKLLVALPRVWRHRRRCRSEREVFLHDIDMARILER